jgi:hypothetical protein
MSNSKRGGKRQQRAAANAVRNRDLAAALTLLQSVSAQHFREDADPEGIYGITEEGKRLLEEAEHVLETVFRTSGSACAERALARLRDFWDEYEGWEYVTERALAFFEEAQADLSTR